MLKKITDKEYFGIDAMSNSRLGEFKYSRKKYHAKYIAKTLPIEADRSAFRLGKMLHCYLLENDVFFERYHEFAGVMPREGYQRRLADILADAFTMLDYNNVNIMCLDAFNKQDLDHLATKAGYKSGSGNRCVEVMTNSSLINYINAKMEAGEFKELIASDELQNIARMAESIQSVVSINPLFCLLEHAAEYELCGLPFKSKYDIIAQFEKTIYDIKTTNSVDAESIYESINNYGYARQAAVYLDSLKQLGYNVDTFVFIFVEKKFPHAVKTVRLSSDTIAKGRAEYELLIAEYKDCVEKDLWEHAEILEF